MLNKINRFFEWFASALTVALLIGFTIYATMVAIERKSHPLLVFLLCATISVVVVYRLFQSRKAVEIKHRRAQQLFRQLDLALAWDNSPKDCILSLAMAESICLRSSSEARRAVLELKQWRINLCFVLLGVACVAETAFLVLQQQPLWSALTALVFLAVGMFALGAMKLPKRFVADEEGFAIDGQKLTRWTEVTSLHFRDTASASGIGSLLLRARQLEINWRGEAPSRRPWQAEQAGRIRLPLAFYRSNLADADAFEACIKQLKTGLYGNSDIRLRLKKIETKYATKLNELRSRINSNDQEQIEGHIAFYAKLRAAEERELLVDIIKRELLAVLS